MLPDIKLHFDKIRFRPVNFLNDLSGSVMALPDFARQTYAQRTGNFSNVAAKRLLETMERKQSNLCVSVDVTKSSDFISVIDAVGPYIALIKVSLPIFMYISEVLFTNQDAHRCT